MIWQNKTMVYWTRPSYKSCFPWRRSYHYWLCWNYKLKNCFKQGDKVFLNVQIYFLLHIPHLFTTLNQPLFNFQYGQSHFLLKGVYPESTVHSSVTACHKITLYYVQHTYIHGTISCTFTFMVYIKAWIIY